MHALRVWLAVTLAFVVSSSTIEAQPRISIKLFSATPVTESAPCLDPLGCSPVRDRVVFDESALLLSCKAHPTAILSSTSDGRGALVVDNFLEVNGRDVCKGGMPGSVEQCFNPPVIGNIGTPALTAYQPVPPIDISAEMPRGKGTVTFALVDYGGIYASSDVWLYTDCKLHQKVAICHKPGTPAEKILTVGLSAISGHLGHGDTLDLSVCRR